MRRKWRRRVHNWTLKGITTIAVILNIASTGCIEAPEWQWSSLPVTLTVWIITGAWLVAFAYANDWFYKEDGETWDI